MAQTTRAVAILILSTFAADHGVLFESTHFHNMFKLSADDGCSVDILVVGRRRKSFPVVPEWFRNMSVWEYRLEDTAC